MKRFAFRAIIVVAALFLFHHLNEPLTDGIAAKQVFVAHRARTIAVPPFDLTRNTFDFLEPNGERLSLTEEIPVYTGLLAAGYRLFGEKESLGRLLSIIATLIAIVAFHDLVRRDISESLAIPATALLAFSPLLRVYGQAVQPDAWMLASMILACCAWSRFLERRTIGWWFATLACTTIGAMFKYYALMAMVPMSIQTIRYIRWNLLHLVSLAVLGLLTITPVALWMMGVFANTPNPARHEVFFIHQMPELLIKRVLYIRFLDRFLWKDCGPIGMILVGAGAIAAWARKSEAKPLIGWTICGLGFFVLMGPKLRCHDYYEMMMLPAAAMWGAVGWQWLRSRWWRPVSDPADLATAGSESRRNWSCFAIAGFAVLILIHSPWISRHKSDADRSYVAAANRLAEAAGANGRIAVVADDNSVVLIHYAHREGWMAPPISSAEQGQNWLEHCQENGVKYAVIFRQRNATPQWPLLNELAAKYVTIEHGANYDVVRLDRTP